MFDDGFFEDYSSDGFMSGFFDGGWTAQNVYSPWGEYNIT